MAFPKASRQRHCRARHDNPQVNALNIGDTYRLADILDGYKRNLDVRVVILTATGRGFCAGVDIREIQNLPATKASSGPTTRAGSSSARIYECAVPVHRRRQ